MDAALTPFADFLNSLPLDLHYVESAEVRGDGPSVINPNRCDPDPTRPCMIGSSAQRAARFKEHRGIGWRRDSAGQLYTDTRLWGAAYFDGHDTFAADDRLTDADVKSTNESLYADIYTDNHSKRAILTNDGIIDDPNAQICTAMNQRTTFYKCDDVTLRYPTTGTPPAAVESGPDDWQTTAMGNDTYGNYLPNGCPATNTLFLGPIAIDMLKRNTIAHEGGHLLDMKHYDTCSPAGVMGLPFLPIPDNYTATDLAQIRVHRKY